MFRIHFKVTAVATLALAAAAIFSPCAMRSGEAASALEATRATTANGVSLSQFKIVEEKVEKKTFITSRMIIKATPERVWAVLTDYDGAAAIFSNLTKSKLLTCSGSTKIVSFSARSMRLPLEYTLAVTEKYPELIEWKRVSGSFRANEGYWKLEPLDNGKATLVTYAKYVDGGRFYPKVLVKKLIRDSIPKIFMEAKTAAESTNEAK